MRLAAGSQGSGSRLPPCPHPGLGQEASGGQRQAAMGQAPPRAPVSLGGPPASSSLSLPIQQRGLRSPRWQVTLAGKTPGGLKHPTRHVTATGLVRGLRSRLPGTRASSSGTPLERTHPQGRSGHHYRGGRLPGPMGVHMPGTVSVKLARPCDTNPWNLLEVSLLPPLLWLWVRGFILTSGRS